MILNKIIGKIVPSNLTLYSLFNTVLNNCIENKQKKTLW